MSEPLTDTQRLDWLIANGYCPARWREWTGEDDEKLPERNGMVFVGWGEREQIDKAIRRQAGLKDRLAARRVVGDDVDDGVVRPAEVPADDELKPGTGPVGVGDPQ
mgnify:CR=1 FL=1